MPMESQRPDGHHRGALRVLVAEDKEDTAAMLSMLPSLYGYEVEVAPDGPSALRGVQASQPDVVLLDIGLPKVDGWQVAKQIRQLNIAKRPLLIAMTGHGTQEAGIDFHLVKPVDMADLDKVLWQFSATLACDPPHVTTPRPTI
jgi:CheY-like chemotaxis protein